MQLRRIAVRNFRKLVSPVVIDELEPGITVIAGDNEEGKSTLFHAIRTGLVERHNLTGKPVEAMQPFGSSVRPEIRLDFNLEGSPYSITKAFAQKPSAVLTTPGGRLEGPAAEERLAELLTFRVPQRGESKPDDRGILGLFWLEQGHVADGLAFGETGRATLRTSLMDEVGDVLGGARGRKLLQAARAKRDELLTSTGKPRGGLAAAIEDAKSAIDQAGQLEAEHRAFDHEIDELMTVRRELDRIASDHVLERAEAAVAAFEAEAAAIAALRLDEERAEQAVSVAKATFENARDRHNSRRALIHAVATHEEALNAAQGALSELSTSTSGVAERLEAARAVAATATNVRIAAEARLAAAQARARATVLDRELADLQQRIAEVDALAARQATAQDRIARSRVDKTAFEHIQALEGALREAQAALGAVATRVRFLPSAAQTIRKGEELVEAGRLVEVADSTRFSLGGFGAIDVEPGASALADRQAAVRQASMKLGKALAAAGIATVAEATQALAERTQAETDLREATRLIKAHAPKGVEALSAAHRQCAAERDRLAHELSNISIAADSETESRAVAVAKAAEDAAIAALDTAKAAHQDHATELAVAKQRVVSADEALAGASHQLESARAEIDDAKLDARLDSDRAALAAAERRKIETATALAAAKPDEVERRRQQAIAALAAAKTEQRQLRDKEIEFASSLTAAGKSGIGERLEEARGQASQAIARRDALQADAEAWGLLAATLGTAERDAKEAFLAPVLQRVDPFLRLLFPDARVTLDEETFEITYMARDRRDEPFGTLSVGAREQISILVRLAFAVYLREKGYPAAVILDDALVYADDGRFERVQLALRKAAETVQILILTCRARDWRQFGAPIRRLADAGGKAFEP